MTSSWKEKNQELAKYWRAHIDKWSQSGVSQTEYCRRNNLSRDRFTYWKIKFKKENLPVTFVQITPDLAPTHRSGLKLNIGPGLQIEVPDDFSQNTLEKVLMTLRVL